MKLSTKWQRSLFLLTLAAGLCGAPADSGAAFSNGGFESGTAGAAPPSWTVTTYLNSGGITIQSPQTRAGLNLATGGNPLTQIVAGTNQPDPDLGAGASLRWPLVGNQAVIINFHGSSVFGNPTNVNSLKQTMTIGAGDVDPTDGQVHVRFALAPLLQDPAHQAYQNPYVYVELLNLTKGTLLYSRFIAPGQPGVPWKTVNGGTLNQIDYTDWQLYDIMPGSAVAQGDQIQLEVIAAGCQPGGHFGEAYLDSVGSTFPFLNLVAAGPSQANAGSNVTYTYTYRNGGSSAANGAVIAATTPANTTFQSVTPPAGFTCPVSPVVGTAGTVTCTATDPLPAGASGAMTMTVNITPGTTGKISNSDYNIQLVPAMPPVIAPTVETAVGCSRDPDCMAGNWCNESASMCVPVLAGGMPIPTDPPHTNPTLNGTCTAAAGALVCQAGVCDTVDNKCGYAAGDGPCTAANGSSVCRSGACGNNVCRDIQLCGDGYYDNLTACTPCPAQTFQTAGYHTSCQNCSPGTYQFLTGQSACHVFCGAGQFDSGGACSPCLPGSYQATGLNGACIPAPAGTYVSGSGATSPTNCAAGTYQDQTGQTSCQNCPAGTYQLATGQSSCLTIPKAATSIVIDPTTTPATLYAGIDTAGVNKNTDNTNWNPANGTPPNNLTNLRVKALARSASGILFAATYGGGVFKTSDGGTTWDACNTANLTNLNVVSLTIDANGKLYAGTEAGVFTSTNGCASWTAMNTGLPE